MEQKRKSHKTDSISSPKGARFAFKEYDALESETGIFRKIVCDEVGDENL